MSSHPELRRAAVLRAIVEDYVTTREPVGSKTLVERHHLGVSPATIRNDMVLLEEAGLIARPHTSAGRVPTDAGYRAFVDSLEMIKPLSRAERSAFRRILTEAVDLDDVLARAVRLLAQVTRQVAVVQYPSLRQSHLRHVELVRLSPTTVLVVMITNTGRVEQRTLDCSGMTRGQSDEESLEVLLDRLRIVLNAHLTDVPLAQLEKLHAHLPELVDSSALSLARHVLDVIVQTLEADSEERVVVAGTGNLSRGYGDFSESITPVLEALEEQVVLLKLIAISDDGVGVRIGKENESLGLPETSVVSAGYGNADHSLVARLGVLGPTRMDYPAAMSSVLAISQYLTDILQSRGT